MNKFLVMTRGYWGIGTSVREAAEKCDGRLSDRVLLRVSTAHKDDFKLEVDEHGNTAYEAGVESILVLTPAMHRVTLGALRNSEGKKR